VAVFIFYFYLLTTFSIMLQKLKHKMAISRCTRTARHIASLNKPISRIFGAGRMTVVRFGVDVFAVVF
jgi:hypothetical protein